jgi:hypothetical protein
MRGLEPDGRMLPLGRHLLGEHVLDLVGAKSLRQGGPLHGVKQGLGPVVIFERQEFLDLLLQGLIGRGHVFARALRGFASGDKGGDLLGVPVTAVVFLGGFAMLGEFDPLLTLPAPHVRGHGLVLEVARDMGVVGFDHEGFANEPGRHGVGVAITTHGESGVDLGLGRIPAIG